MLVCWPMIKGSIPNFFLHFPIKSPATILISSFVIMTFLPFWVFVLAGCFSVSLAEASNLSDLYPPLWEESPSQLSDYKVENGKYIVNPWVYPERLGAYKILLNKTGSYFEKFGPENKLNLLWGLPLQHGWQYTSGKNDSYFCSNDLPV